MEMKSDKQLFEDFAKTFAINSKIVETIRVGVKDSYFIDDLNPLFDYLDKRNIAVEELKFTNNKLNRLHEHFLHISWKYRSILSTHFFDQPPIEPSNERKTLYPDLKMFDILVIEQMKDGIEPEEVSLIRSQQYRQLRYKVQRKILRLEPLILYVRDNIIATGKKMFFGSNDNLEEQPARLKKDNNVSMTSDTPTQILPPLSISFNGRIIKLNDNITLARTHVNSNPNNLFQHLYDNPGQRFNFEEIKHLLEDEEQFDPTELRQMPERLGFTYDLHKAFFDVTTSKKKGYTIAFYNHLQEEDLKQRLGKTHIIYQPKKVAKTK